MIVIARKITSFVRISNNAVNKFHQIQEELSLPMNTLVHDVSTRWNSSFHMVATYKKGSDKIESVIDFSSIPVNMHKAVPLALIINELWSNSLKHAFEKKSSGKMGVTGRMENTFLHLFVYDDGPGFSPDFTNLSSASLGLHLVKMLAEQLDAEYHYQHASGRSEFSFLIPMGH